MRLFVLLGSVALVFGACGVATSPAPAPTALASQTVAAATSPASPGGASPATTQLAAFLTMTLTDARTGEKFTIGDFKGKVTIVEGMAVW